MRVRLSVCYQLVKLFIVFEQHGIFYHILHTYACQHSLTTGMRTHLFLIDMTLLSTCSACCGYLVNILITLEPSWIFGSNFAYLLVLILSSHLDMHNGGEGLPSINLTGRGLLVKMHIVLDAWNIIIKFCILIHFNIIKTQVCKTVIRLCEDFLR